MKKLIIKIPDWFKRAAPDSCIDSKEFAEILGYAEPSNFLKELKRNKDRYPPPDKLQTHLGEKRTNNKIWKVSTIRKYLETLTIGK